MTGELESSDSLSLREHLALSQPSERGSMKIWSCKIGEVEDSALPHGSDWPMRQAVIHAYRELTGREPRFTFSGWGAELDDMERAVVVEGPRSLAGEHLELSQPTPSRAQRLAAAEAEFGPIVPVRLSQPSEREVVARWLWNDRESWLAADSDNYNPEEWESAHSDEQDWCRQRADELLALLADKPPDLDEAMKRLESALKRDYGKHPVTIAEAYQAGYESGKLAAQPAAPQPSQPEGTL